MPRQTKGRQKINMAKMQNESNLQVTFSKRRAGLFKKASELATLCGVDLGIIVFSPGNKAFSFGQPTVDAIIDRFLTRNPPPSTGTHQFIEAQRNATVRDLNMRLTYVQNMLEAERQRGGVLQQMRKASRGQNWWEAPFEQLNLQQLEWLKSHMKELKSNVAKQADKLARENTENPLPFLAGPSGGNGSGGVFPFMATAGPSSFGPGAGVLSFAIGSSSFEGGGSGGPFPIMAGPGLPGGDGGLPFFPSYSGVAGGGSPLLLGPSSSNGGLHFLGGPRSSSGGAGLPFPAGMNPSGGVGGLTFPAGPSSSGGGGSGGCILPFSAGPSSLGGGGGVSPFSPGPSSSGGGGGGVPFDTRASEPNGSLPVASYGYNHGYRRGFF